MAGALSAEDGQLTGDTAQVYFDVSYALGAPAAGVAIAAIAAPIALVALRSRRLIPRWGAWVALGLAVVMLTPVMLTPAYGLPFAVALFLLGWLSIRLHRAVPAPRGAEVPLL